MEKQEKQTSKKDYLHITMWLIFLCFLVVFTINSFTYAQYTTSGNGQDGATIAKFYVNSPNTDSISVDFNGSLSEEKTIPFQVVNFNGNVVNEVLLKYSIQVINVYENLPLEYKLTCTSVNAGDDIDLDNNYNDSGHEWTGGKLLASTPCTHNYTLTIRWKSGQYDAITYASEIDVIKIRIDSEQID